jgi:hypothetical protein
MTDMFVVTPYDVYTKKEFCEKKEQLAKEGRKVMAVVFNCHTIQEFEERYFGEQICFDKEVLARCNKRIAEEG